MRPYVPLAALALHLCALQSVAQTPAPVPSGTAAPGAPAGGPPGARVPLRDGQRTTTGTAVLRGRVVRADNRAPLRRVQVRASSSDTPDSRATMTDDNGRWELTQLPASRYTLFASKEGFVSMQFGQRRAIEGGQPIELRDGEVLEQLDFALSRGGVITGRVVDDVGEPVTGAMIQVSRYRFLNGQRRLLPVATSGQTDDLGQFRVWSIPPGEYYVAATLRMFLPPGVQARGVTGYAPTYYPGTPVLADAHRVKVERAEEVAITFPLFPARAASISGAAHRADGTPMVNAVVMLSQANPNDGGFMSVMNMFGTVRPDGTFTISGVTPGEYRVDIRPQGGPAVETASADVSVAGADITGLVLVATKGATARGRISFETATPPADVRPATLRVMTQPIASNMMMMGSPPAVVKDDWTFELEGLSGERLVRIATPPGWFLKSVQNEGTEITDTPLEFRGSDVEGIEIVLTQRVTDVSGTVTDDRGTKVTDATVVLFTEDREKWRPLTRFVRLTKPDQDGRFKVRALPPGRYLAVALDYLEPGEETNPETLEDLRRRASAIVLRDGETTTVDLRVKPEL